MRATARISPVVVRDAQQPGDERRIPLKAREAAPRLNEGFLREIVGQRLVTASEMAEEVAHGGLVISHQFPERGAIAGDDCAGDQFLIGHVRCDPKAGGWACP